MTRFLPILGRPSIAVSDQRLTVPLVSAMQPPTGNPIHAVIGLVLGKDDENENGNNECRNTYKDEDHNHFLLIR
jgi:hypothetical protein